MGLNKKWFTLLIILLIAAAAYYRVHIFSEIETGRPDAVHQEGASTQKISSSANETHPSFSNHQPNRKRDLSNPTTGAQIPPETINFAALKKTGLNLKLWGTITGNRVNAYALIEETTNRKQKLYRVGDTIRNATVKMILRQKVVLRVDEHDEILEIETGKADVDAKDKYGVTALIDASFKGQKEIVELLIIEGADLNAQNNQGDTALMNAAIKGHRQIAELLIKSGADVHVRDNLGNSALIDSAKYARESTCEVIAVLIDAGADVNAKNKYGVTALMNAAQWGHLGVVDCLIAEGADVNAKSKSGETALKLAADIKDMAELLKQNGAKE